MEICWTRSLDKSAPSSKKLHYVYDKVSTEKGRLPQQKALTQEIATIREWLVNSGALIRWTADENMIMNGLTKDHKESRQHLARVPQKEDSGAYKETLRWFARNRRLNENVHARRNLSRLKCVRVRRSCTTSLILRRMHGSSFLGTVSSKQFSTVTQNVAYVKFFFQFLNSEASILGWFFFFAKNVLSVIVSHVLLVARFFLKKIDLRLSHQSRIFYDVNVSDEIVFCLACAHLFTQAFRSSTGVWFVRR